MDDQRTAASAADGVRFRILGSLATVAGDGTEHPVVGPRRQTLLAALLVHRGEVVSVDRLVDLLWGSDATPGSVTTLRTHVANVRAAVEGTGTGARVVNCSGGYQLKVDAARIDAVVFERLTESARAALGRGALDEADRLFREALGLWRGAALQDVATPLFGLSTIAHLEELKTTASATWMQLRLRRGEHDSLVPALTRLVEEHPFHEHFTGLLMRALYRAGRQTEALAAFTRASGRLADELGLDPGPELRGLELAILRQDPALVAGRVGERPSAGTPAATAPRLATV